MRVKISLILSSLGVFYIGSAYVDTIDVVHDANEDYMKKSPLMQKHDKENALKRESDIRRFVVQIHKMDYWMGRVKNLKETLATLGVRVQQH